MTSHNRMNNFKRMVDRLAVSGKLLTTQEVLGSRFLVADARSTVETWTPMLRLVLRPGNKNVPQ